MLWIFFQKKVQRLPDSPLDGDADRHEDAPRVRDRREGVKEELVQLGVDPAAREVEQHVERHQLDTADRIGTCRTASRQPPESGRRHESYPIFRLIARSE